MKGYCFQIAFSIHSSYFSSHFSPFEKTFQLRKTETQQRGRNPFWYLFCWHLMFPTARIDFCRILTYLFLKRMHGREIETHIGGKLNVIAKNYIRIVFVRSNLRRSLGMRRRRSRRWMEITLSRAKSSFNIIIRTWIRELCLPEIYYWERIISIFF